MGLFQSEAESIYKAWNTRAAKAATTPQARATGAFDTFRQNGFDVVVDKLNRYRTRNGDRAAAEQVWKLLDKFGRRKGNAVASELLKAMKADNDLKRIIENHPAENFRNLSDVTIGYAATLDPNHVIFEGGLHVKVLRKLGQGGMGGAVFLAEDGDGKKYALKHFLRPNYKIDGFGVNTPRGKLDKTQTYLLKYFEAALTTTCVDALTIGRDEYILLQLGEGDVDYTKLNMADVVSVFRDMQRLYEYDKHHMKTDITQGVSVIHMDIHGENLMRFGGELRLIDFGQALIYCPGQDEKVRAAEAIRYDRNNHNLYFQNEDYLNSKKAYFDPDRGSWQSYIADWQAAYRVAPIIQMCTGCNRRYPAGLDIKTCMGCGGRNIEHRKLTRAEIEQAARVKTVTSGKPLSPGSIGDNPYATGRVNSVNPQQYGCIVLTAVLIQEIWAASEKGVDKGMGGSAARAIMNVEVYSKARLGQYKFKAEGQAGMVDILLGWYDEMMRRLFDGEPFTARDAVTYFGGGKGVSGNRQRRHSVSF